MTRADRLKGPRGVLLAARGDAGAEPRAGGERHADVADLSDGERSSGSTAASDVREEEA